jgi:hypothetical protein
MRAILGDEVRLKGLQMPREARGRCLHRNDRAANEPMIGDISSIISLTTPNRSTLSVSLRIFRARCWPPPFHARRTNGIISQCSLKPSGGMVRRSISSPMGEESFIQPSRSKSVIAWQSRRRGSNREPRGKLCGDLVLDPKEARELRVLKSYHLARDGERASEVDEELQYRTSFCASGATGWTAQSR